MFSKQYIHIISMHIQKAPKREFKGVCLFLTFLIQLSLEIHNTITSLCVLPVTVCVCVCVKQQQMFMFWWTHNVGRLYLIQWCPAERAWALIPSPCFSCQAVYLWPCQAHPKEEGFFRCTAMLLRGQQWSYHVFLFHF